MAFNCPRCQSENTQKLSMLHELGTSIIDTATVGGGVGSHGSLGVGAANTTGTSQTKLAQKYAPPKKEPVLGAFFGCAFLGLIASIFFSGVAFLIGAVLGVFAAYAGYKKNKEEYPAKLRQWQSQFLCLRCENLFVPHE